MIYEKNIAMIAHETNRAYCAAIGDMSQLPWDQAPEWQRQSALAGVMNIKNNPGTTPEQSHESWLNAKSEDGWKYGPVKNPDKKEHPCFVPYSELPEDQKMKDKLFTLVVKALLGV